MEEPLIPLASEDSDLGDGGDFESFSGKYWLLLIFLLCPVVVAVCFLCWCNFVSVAAGVAVFAHVAVLLMSCC